MKLLLVDDEEYSRNGIISLVTWENLGIHEVKIATDGNEGLKLARTFHPDIVMTDIRMPHMDGITMCSKIKELLPYCCFIIISAYSDKEYFKSAINLSAVNYLEKPFMPQELIDSIKKAIARRTSLTSEISILQQNNKLPAVENHIVMTLLRQHSEADNLWKQIRDFYPAIRFYRHWQTLLISFWNVDNKEVNTNLNFQKNIFSLIRKHFSNRADDSVLLGMKLENMIIAHVSFDKNTDMNIRIGSLCNDIGHFLEQSWQYNISVGEAADNIYEIYNSYESALIGHQQSFFLEPNSITFYHRTAAPLIYNFKPEDIDHFTQLLKAHNSSAAADFVRNLCQELRKHDYTLISTMKDFFSQLIRRLYYYSDSFILSSFSQKETLTDSINTVWNLRYLKQIEQYMYSKIDMLFQEIKQISSDMLENPLPNKIKNYVDANYCDPELCLQSISDHFNITTSYICIVFKKNYQKTINQYINDRRIEKSIDYLSHSDKKIKEISSLIGYPDSNYFIKVFKKASGFTPKEYRRQ